MSGVETKTRPQGQCQVLRPRLCSRPVPGVQTKTRPQGQCQVFRPRLGSRPVPGIETKTRPQGQCQVLRPRLVIEDDLSVDCCVEGAWALHWRQVWKWTQLWAATLGRGTFARSSTQVWCSRCKDRKRGEVGLVWVFVMIVQCMLLVQLCGTNYPRIQLISTP